jgi:RNA polymerase sigma factor (sigma-70 family)
MSLLVEDRPLLEAFRRGEISALERVYRHYAPKVAIAVRRGFTVNGAAGPTLIRAATSQFESDGIVQEVFVRAFTERARNSYDGLRPYLDFLVGISRHIILDQGRRQGSREVLTDLTTGEWALADDPAPSAEETLVDTAARDLVRRFLDEQCDEKDRKLYLLRFQDDLAQEATAKEVGLTRIQIRRWETKFRARLLRFLKRERYVP